MRKVHYRVVLDVFTVEDEKAIGNEAIGNMIGEVDLTGECGRGFGGSVNVESVDVESVECTDSR